MPNCGGTNQPPCKPVPTAVINGVEYWDAKAIEDHGKACYEKGLKDAKK
jgi:hypothetical protein